MNCHEASDLLLEADLAELAGEGEANLAQHVRSCASCRAVADRILVSERAMANAVAALAPARRATTAAENAWRKARRRKQRRRLATYVIPGLAAAGLAGVLLNRTVVPPHTPAPPRIAQQMPSLIEPPPGQNVVVFNTGDSKVVVVWLY